jgi:tRNA(Ile)-lysidine synthetase-like protein
MMAPMDDLAARTRAFIHRRGLLSPGETVVVGVSGGPDSLCLLHILVGLTPEYALWLHVAHLNHGLRDADADADARFVEEVAARWGLPCTVGSADVAGIAVRDGLSIEEAGRQARYAFLRDTAQQAGATAVAVGHHADDQAETVLMHFLRGSGVAGLRGMLPSTPLAGYRLPGDGDPGEIRLIRPLLAERRSDIDAYCAEHHLNPRIDQSNDDIALHRNRLRHHLLPLLESYNPGIRESLVHTAEVMAGDHELLRDQADRAWADAVRSSSPGEILFDRMTWRRLPVGMQRALVREAIRRLRSGLRDVNWDHIERAVMLAQAGETGQAATLVGGLALEVGYTALRIAPEGAAGPVDAPQVSEETPLTVPGVTEVGDWRVVIESAASEAPPVADWWSARLDADAVGAELLLRPRLPGDRFQPQGMGGHSMKLNEFMINAKVPRAARSGWPLLIGRQGIAWVCGQRVDERAAVTPATRHIWVVRFEH